MYLYRARTQTKVSGLCQPDMSFMEIKPQHMLQFYKPWLQKYLCTARTVVQPKLQRHCSRGQGCVQSRQYESECRQRKTQDMVFESFRIPQFMTSCYFWYVYTHINTHLYTHTVYIYICVYVCMFFIWNSGTFSAPLEHSQLLWFSEANHDIHPHQEAPTWLLATAHDWQLMAALEKQLRIPGSTKMTTLRHQTDTDTVNIRQVVKNSTGGYGWGGVKRGKVLLRHKLGQVKSWLGHWGEGGRCVESQNTHWTLSM